MQPERNNQNTKQWGKHWKSRLSKSCTCKQDAVESLLIHSTIGNSCRSGIVKMSEWAVGGALFVLNLVQLAVFSIYLIQVKLTHCTTLVSSVAEIKPRIGLTMPHIMWTVVLKLAVPQSHTLLVFLKQTYKWTFFCDKSTLGNCKKELHFRKWIGFPNTFLQMIHFKSLVKLLWMWKNYRKCSAEQIKMRLQNKIFDSSIKFAPVDAGTVAKHVRISTFLVRVSL